MKSFRSFILTLIFSGWMLLLPVRSSASPLSGVMDTVVGKMVEMLVGPPPEAPMDDEEEDEDWEDEEDSTTTVQSAGGDSLTAKKAVMDSAAQTVVATTATPVAQPAPGTTETAQPTQATAAPTAGTTPAAAVTTPAATIPAADVATSDEEEEDEESGAADSTKATEEDKSISERLEEIKNRNKNVVRVDYRRLRNIFDFDPNNIIKPPPPKQEQIVLQPIDMGKIVLNGIMWSNKTRQALITGEDGKGYFITVGDRVKGVTVEDIQPDKVVFVQRVGTLVQRTELKLKKEE